MICRLIVTRKCDRACEGCCNDSLDYESLKLVKDIDELIDYEAVIITGGEPMLQDESLFYMLQRIRENGYSNPIYLQTARYTPWMHSIIKLIDGITYTLHDNPSPKDLSMLNWLQRLEQPEGFSMRLNIDAREWSNVEVSSRVFPFVFKEVRKMEWKDECPIPENEELCIIPFA